MNNHTTLKTLFTTLYGSLPYEYDVLYASTEDTGNSISISKTGAAGIIYITTNTPDDDCIFDILEYADAYDSEPAEISQWDTDDPNLTLTDLIAYIEKSL